MSKKNATTTSETITSKDVGTVPAAVLAASAPTTVQTPAAVNKAAIANAIFAECYANGADKAPQRKDILARVKTEAGLTDAGAATYLQNYKRKNGLSKAPLVGDAPGAIDAEAAAAAAAESVEKGE